MDSEGRPNVRWLAGQMGAYVATLAPWTHFVTNTAADPGERWSGYSAHGVAYVERAWESWVAAFRPVASWAAMESHKSRTTPHLHAVVAVSPGNPDFDPDGHLCDASPDRLHMRAWCETKRALGRNQIVAIRDVRDVTAYVAKYVNKGIGKLYVQGIGVEPVVVQGQAVDWLRAISNAELAERDDDDVRLLVALHASNVELGQAQLRLRARRGRLIY